MASCEVIVISDDEDIESDDKDIENTRDDVDSILDSDNDSMTESDSEFFNNPVSLTSKREGLKALWNTTLAISNACKLV